MLQGCMVRSGVTELHNVALYAAWCGLLFFQTVTSVLHWAMMRVRRAELRVSFVCNAVKSCSSCLNCNSENSQYSQILLIRSQQQQIRQSIQSDLFMRPLQQSRQSIQSNSVHYGSTAIVNTIQSHSLHLNCNSQDSQ